MEQESDLVTGEAVVLDVRAAKLASRGLAMMIDVALQLVTLVVAMLVLSQIAAFGDEALALTLFLVTLVLVMVGYPVIFETLSRGRTLGKMALGLRVVRTDGGPIRFRHALVRGLAGFFVDFWALGLLGVVAVITSLLSPNGRRVGDYLAGTLVIRERMPAARTPYVGMPPQLAYWASQLDLTRLPNDLALAVRQYLSRTSELRPEAAEALGYGLAQQVAGEIGAPVPPGVPSWAYLSAVLAERRRRDQEKLRPQYAQPVAPAVSPAVAQYAPPGQYAPQGEPVQSYGQSYPQSYPQAAAPAPVTPPQPETAPEPENPFAPPG
ncbi:RDD family protein [Amycolatopsis thailandensis]|uniref:RDD family protein n=1 Tax=Amycolatopsis thailandensis TaxID=589330 RepID=A0A229RX69_9PSEU|nr:RDD family protein [Amycolatopsis thailandensis]OXM51101.1 RDD family protein [Amycolatopsis thailandensis]